MAEPRNTRPSGAAYGTNGRITSPSMGSLDVKVKTLTHGIKINSQESIASQAKTFYPQKVSSGPFTITIEHVSIEDRDFVNQWMRRYMERASANLLDDLYLIVSVPGRRFHQRGVPEGTLEHGDSVSNMGRIYTTRLTFVASSKPAARVDVSRVRHSEDWEILKHYPAGLQAGWSTEEGIYDDPSGPGSGGRAPILRPGDPPRAV